MNKVAEIISTVFYVGRIPFAPGSICSFLAFLSWYYLRFYIEGVFILYASLILFFVGVAVSTIYSESIKKEDPPEVVIDEWVGQWIALWLIPHSFYWGLLSFVIFRVFDVLKLGPVQGMDDIKSGTGIMMDDIVAGIFALLITQSLVYFIG